MGAPRIHPSAIVHPGAALGDDVEIGPLAIVGDQVELGPGTRVLAAAAVLGPCRMGAGNVIHSYAVVGGAPQDYSYRGEPTGLVIGEGNEFREHVTINRGTTKDKGLTIIGSRGLFMAGCHVAHDCRVGDHATLANATLLGGHVALADHVATGGHVAVQPYVRVGESAFLAGGAMVEHDVPPFVVAAGDRARVRGLNRVGLARRGVPAASQAALKRAFRALYRAGLPRAEALARLAQEADPDPFVAALVAFFAPAG